MQKNESSAKSAKEIVMEFIQAVERKDWKAVRSYISDNLSDVSPLNSFDGAEAYLKYAEYAAEHRNIPPLDIKKEFADGNDVCLLYEMTYGKPPVTTIFCRWFHLNDDGKISSIRWVFDPRPLFPQK
jgi:ketosteroid isomerase-like protein